MKSEGERRYEALSDKMKSAIELAIAKPEKPAANPKCKWCYGRGTIRKIISGKVNIEVCPCVAKYLAKKKRRSTGVN